MSSQQKTTSSSAAAPAINDRIRAEKVQLIAADGQNCGIVSRDIALRSAREAGLDLVVIAERGQGGVPVTKVMDYGKLLYERKKQLADAKKKQHIVQVKELKIRPKISDHDLQTKMQQALDFLIDGKRVKITLVFRGREVTMRDERGSELFERINQLFAASEHGKLIMYEQDSRADMLWSRVYYMKK